MNNYLLNSYQYLQKGQFTPFPAVFFFSSSMELDHFLIKLLFIRRIRTGVTKKHQNKTQCQLCKRLAGPFIPLSRLVWSEKEFHFGCDH